MQKILPASQATKILLIGIVILGSLLSGLAIPYFGVQILVPVLLPFVAILILIRPDLGLLLTIALLPLENVIVVCCEITVVRLLGIYVMGAWILKKVLQRESLKPLFSTFLFKSAVPLFFLIAISTVWSINSSKTYDGLFQLLRMLLLALLVMDLANSQKKVDWMIKALVIGGLIAAPLVLYQFFFLGATRAGDNIAGGVNGTAALLVLVVQLAFYVIRSQKNRFWRWIGTIYIFLAILAVLVTFSRTSYLILAVVFVVNYWDALKDPKLLLPLVATVAMLFAIFRLLPSDLIFARVLTMGTYTQETFNSAGEETTLRGFAWRVGLAMFRSNPFLGVGYGTFNDAYADYKYDVKSIVSSRGSARSAHNVYIGFLAELGLIGLALWLVLLFAGFPKLYRAYTRLSKKRSSNQWFLVQALMYCFLLEVIYGWAINISENKTLWFLLGLNAAVVSLIAKDQPIPPIQENLPGKTTKANGMERNGMRG